MGTKYQSRVPDPQSLLSILDAADPKCTSGSGNLKDKVAGLEWQRITAVTDTVEDNITCFDMNGGYLEKSGSAISFGQYYTCFYLWKPKEADTKYRTLHRNNNDHIGIVQIGTKNLGMYANRNGGGFRDSGYDISIEWQTLILTGEGDTSSSDTGTTTYYVNGVNVGTSDRVGCGTSLYRVGWGGQHPGYMAIMGCYDKLLDATEIEELHNHLQKRIQP